MAHIILKHCKYFAAKTIDHFIGQVCGVGLYRTNRNMSPVGAGTKILLIALDHLGDTVIGTPTIEALKSTFPQVEVTVLTRPSNAAVFLKNPFIGKVLADNTPWWSGSPVYDSLRPSYWKEYFRNIRQIRRDRYEVIIDLRGDLRHLLLFGAAARPRYLLGYGRTGGDALLSAIVRYDADMHEIDKKLALLAPLGITGVRPAPKIWLSPEEIARARQFVTQLIGDARTPIILMDPGAKPIQRWPLACYTRLAGTLNRRFHQVVLVSAGPLYSHLAEELVRGAGEESARFVGNMGLRDLMALIAACDLVISSDTGIAHISSAVGTRTVTLFGPTDPARFWHGVTGSRVVQSPEPCCSEELHETCLKPSNPVPGYCMEMISDSQVDDAVMATLSDLLRSNSFGISHTRSSP